MSGSVGALETRTRTSVATLAELSRLDETAFSTGEWAFVVSSDAFFVLKRTSVAVVDGTNVLATRSGTGRWIRIDFSSFDPTFAYVTNNSTFLLSADDDMIFNNLGIGSGITLPAPGGTTLTILTSGTYNFDFQARGTPMLGVDVDTDIPLVFQLHANGIAVPQSRFASALENTLSITPPLGTELVIGSGTAALIAGDLITLHNRTNDGGDDVQFTAMGIQPVLNASLRLARIS